MSPSSRVRWVATESAPLGAIMSALDAGEQAIEQGRVFVNGARASAGTDAVSVGDVVEAFAERAAASSRATILEQRGGIVAAFKPAALPTVPDHRGTASLLHDVAATLSLPPERVHAASRLDVGVSGVVLLGVDAAGNSSLSQAREAGHLRRRYLAIASRSPGDSKGCWRGAIERAGKSRDAETLFDVREVSPRTVGAAGRGDTDVRAALLDLEPRTGRTHQLRIHAARAGAPLLGDRAHGGPTRLVLDSGAIHEIDRIALHAASVELTHMSWRVDAPIPAELRSLWRILGGAELA